ncbi:MULTISPECIES: DUF4360 domain-containing protein [Streptomyces]|uniref:DUF4360 domain-containing protein n=1 Tax=Streptomyces lycii TaxID=2654337 RepID=A0ABQ7FJV2_9ACTN|nr:MULTISPECIES: DUF4360 domain-containing protein [Streptomyces]KAF4407513.1 DUF4360 domain-containing protein [Streptomyces lycii]PGH52187.1 hypothetical protein CRI70_02590 [Streptomyces sp. Ru87]
MPGIIAAGGAAAALFASALSVQSAPVVEETPSVTAEVEVVTVNGSGCPSGTARVDVASDNASFSVTYSDYIAQVGLGGEPIDFRKNCQLSLQIDVPSGYTYAVLGLEHRGYTFLKKGATGLQRTEYYFQGDSDGVVHSRSFTGPYQGSWRTTDSDSDDVLWAPCGDERNLNINTELRVNGGSSDNTTSPSFLAMRSSGLPDAAYQIAYKKC